MTDAIGSTLCAVVDASGRDCAGPVPSDAPINVCMPHMVQAFLHVRDRLRPRQASLVDLFGDPITPWRPRPDTSFVYYVRNGDLIKIGTSRNLWARMNDIPGILLAVEPGDRETEQQRHEQFAALRLARNREWFQAAPELERHVADLRQRHGDPVARRYESGHLRPLWRLMLDTTAEKVKHSPQQD